MQSILILKTGALGDVLRTTSILPGLRSVHPEARIEWITAPAAQQLVEGHELIERVHLFDAKTHVALGASLQRRPWDWLISLDDEEALCAFASRLGAKKLSGAYLDERGRRVYSDDVAPWFDMGLLSRLGKAAADRLKIVNERSHPEIYAEMLGVPLGRPALRLPDASREKAAQRLKRESDWTPPLVGLNTGAGGRWVSKQLPVERVIAFVEELHAALDGRVTFVLLGGPDESARNAAIRAGVANLSAAPTLLDGGTDNSLLEFAGLVERLDLLLTSDSLALHIAIARRVPVVAFFAPTSAAEIELYGTGEKVCSQSADYCSYRPEADNRTITSQRLVVAAQRVLSAQRSA